MIDGNKVRLKGGHYLAVDGADDTVWKETQRPGRWFRGGVKNRSFRIVLSTVDTEIENFVWDFDDWEHHAQCETMCNTPQYTIHRSVRCLNTATKDYVGDSFCSRSQKPYDQRICPETRDCGGLARFVKFNPVKGPSWCVDSWNEVEVFGEGVIPSSNMGDKTLSDNHLNFEVGSFAIDGNTRWRSLDSSLRSRLTGRTSWGHPGKLIDDDLNVGNEPRLKQSVNFEYCDFLVDLGLEGKQVGKVRIFALGKSLGGVAATTTTTTTTTTTMAEEKVESRLPRRL